MMKKRIFASIVAILIILPIFFIRAEENYDGSIYRFNDYAEVVSEEESKALNDIINNNIEALKMDFPIFILDTYNYDGEMLDYANIVFGNNKFGYGERKDGIFLIIDMENEETQVFLFGSAVKDIPKLKQNEFFAALYEFFDEDASKYEILKNYLDCAFALTKEWHIEKGDKSDGMPYWYADDVESFQNYHAENPVRVVDNAGIFTPEQEAELTEQVERICSTYDFSYVIFTDDDSHGLVKDLYGADFIYYGGYGKDDDYSAVCFFLCLEQGNRGWRTISTNSYEQIFNSDVTYTIDEIVDKDMRSGDYFTAIKKQADYIEKSLSEGNFETIPKHKAPNFFGWPLIVGIIIAFVIAEMVISGMKSKMRLSIPVSANEYLVKNSISIRDKSVKYLYSTITRTRKAESSSGGSSHSSGSASSGGSYSSGGRDF